MKKNDTAPCLPKGSIKPLGWLLRPHCPSPAPDFFPVSNWGSSLLLVFRPETQESSCHVSSTLLFNPQCILLALPSKGTLRPHLPSPARTKRSRPVQQDNDNPFLFSTPTSHPILQGPPNAPQSPTQSVTTPPCLHLLFLCHSAPATPGPLLLLKHSWHHLRAFVLSVSSAWEFFFKYPLLPLLQVLVASSPG